jgi:hypothetical protein
MPESEAHRTPFVLGTPIKNPADFFGRKGVLGELYDAILDHQLVTVVGEHRCGNTSVIYQLLHPEQRDRYLSGQQDESLQFAIVSAQLGSESTRAFLRRIGLSLRRADAESRGELPEEVDQIWLENYLEDLADRGRRLVLLIDEIEVLADLESSFWEWFQGLITQYDVAIVATSRSDLGRFRSEREVGPPFFNMFRSVYIGSFSPETVSHFFREKSEITDFDFFGVRDFIEELAGRFPYYMQVASALCYLQGAGGSALSDEQRETVRREFAARTRMLFDDAWPKLPPGERDALTWMVLGDPPAEHATELRQATQSLERRGYVLEGRIFSRAFSDYVRERIRRLDYNPDTLNVRVERAIVNIPPKEGSLLAYLMSNEGKVVSRDEIEHAVWPEHADEPGRFTDAMFADVLARLRQVIDAGAPTSHVEQVGGQGYRFENAPLGGT